MAEGTKENHFEDDVVKSLVTHSKYIQQDTSVYDKDLCLMFSNASRLTSCL